MGERQKENIDRSFHLPVVECTLSLLLLGPNGETLAAKHTPTPKIQKAILPTTILSRAHYSLSCLSVCLLPLASQNFMIYSPLARPMKCYICRINSRRDLCNDTAPLFASLSPHRHLTLGARSLSICETIDFELNQTSTIDCSSPSAGCAKCSTIIELLKHIFTIIN